MSITKFDGEYRFLSNFYNCKIIYEELEYPTAEHAFQAAKSLDENERIKIQSLKNPVKAKIMGRKIQLRPDWEEIKCGIMTDVLRQKFLDPKLKSLLLQTGNKTLEEGNKWHDKYWGKCICQRCKGIGKNKLGLILMEVRKELSTQQGTDPSTSLSQ